MVKRWDGGVGSAGMAGSEPKPGPGSVPLLGQIAPPSSGIGGGVYASGRSSGPVGSGRRDPIGGRSEPADPHPSGSELTSADPPNPPGSPGVLPAGWSQAGAGGADPGWSQAGAGGGDVAQGMSIPDGAVPDGGATGAAPYGRSGRLPPPSAPLSLNLGSGSTAGPLVSSGVPHRTHAVPPIGAGSPHAEQVRLFISPPIMPPGMRSTVRAPLSVGAVPEPPS
jgi:hypothetical protein